MKRISFKRPARMPQQPAPLRPVIFPSIAFTMGRDAAKQKIPLKKSALKNLMLGSDRYYDYIDGYDSFKKVLQENKL
jgi:hypothetical protein